MHVQHPAPVRATPRYTRPRAAHLQSRPISERISSTKETHDNPQNQPVFPTFSFKPSFFSHYVDISRSFDASYVLRPSTTARPTRQPQIQGGQSDRPSFVGLQRPKSQKDKTNKRNERNKPHLICGQSRISSDYLHAERCSSRPEKAVCLAAQSPTPPWTRIDVHVVCKTYIFT